MLTESPLYGVPVDVISTACGVHPDTARRWKRQGNAPAGALALIRALWNYELGPVSAPWDGWCLRQGDLVSPQGDRFSPEMLLAARYYREMIRELERALAVPRQLSF